MAATAKQQLRYAGTYKIVPKVEWETLKAANFGNPDWAALYPLKNGTTPVGMLTPRLACKLFFDGVFILEKTDENIKYLQDKLPSCTHKYYKKKQWRKQFLEGAERVLCRLAKGKNFSPNCASEEMFTYILLQGAFEMGWNRSRSVWETLPESDKDRDLGRVIRLGTNEEMGALFRLESAPDNVNFKDWFKAVNASDAALADHLIPVATA